MSRQQCDEMYTEANRLKSFQNWPFGEDAKCSAVKEGNVYGQTSEDIFYSYFCEFMFRRLYTDSSSDNFRKLFDAVKEFCLTEDTKFVNKMAEAGFFHCPTDIEPDLVQCYVCFKELDGWQLDDEPWEEHYSHSKVCLFAQLRKPQKDLNFEEIHKIEAARKINKVKKLTAQRLQKFEEAYEDMDALFSSAVRENEAKMKKK